MSPGGAIFFLPIHTRESVFLPHLLATLDSHCHLWATLPRIADQRALRMVTIGQGLRDFRGCCKPAVSGLGGYRPGLPAQRGTEAIQPADYRQPQGASPPPGLRATCDGSRARTQKRGPERAREFGGVKWSGVIGVPAPFVLRVVPGCLGGVEVRVALRGQWLTGLGAATTRASDLVTR